MRFGLYLPIEGPFAEVRLLASLARDAESAGWDGLFIWDELLPIFEHSDQVREAVGESGDVADAGVALTAIAAATARIRFGAMVTPLARLRPEAFARQTATLDRFSGGRLILGVGLGSPPTQFSLFGLPTEARQRAAMLDEFLELLARFWTGQPVDHRGEHYLSDGVSLVPTPLQSPRIPIWVGADSSRRAPRRRAARWDGFVPASEEWPHGVISPDEYRAIAADIAAHRTKPQDAPFDLVVIGNAAGTLPAPEALGDYAQAGVTWALYQALTVDHARARIRRGPPSDPV